jgi:hypothetical protein
MKVIILFLSIFINILFADNSFKVMKQNQLNLIDKFSTVIEDYQICVINAQNDDKILECEKVFIKQNREARRALRQNITQRIRKTFEY